MQVFLHKLYPHSRVCPSVGIYGCYSVFLSPRDEIYDKHPENTVSLTDSSVIIIAMDVKTEGYIKQNLSRG